jgi:Skp family chaperone for outer membrane proteins
MKSLILLLFCPLLLASEGQPILFIDTQMIYVESREAKDLSYELTETEHEYEQATIVYDDLKKDYADQKMPDEGGLPTMIRQLEDQIDKLSKQLTEMENKIKDICRTIAKERNAVCILTCGQCSDVVYVDPKYNISQEIINRLNQQYDRIQQAWLT